LLQFLGGIKRFNFGGTCYANNGYLNQLLINLGYRVKLCGADMDNPDVHIVNIVTIDEKEYLVDTGYGAPFVKPLPLDLKADYEIESGSDRYRLKPKDKGGCSRMEFYRDGELKHGYTAKPTPRQIDYFAKVIQDSYRDTAAFMNRLVLVRFFPNRTLTIRGLSLVETEGGKSRIHRLESRDELPEAVEKYFSIPQSIVSEAVADLTELGDAYD
ncbi:MAG: arylamine N-acetyltransferase, partial [candidate division Zixibacteria bacterium]